MKPVLAALALVLLASSAAAIASGHGSDKMDCPMHDPAATAEDRARHLDQMFAKLDANGDGSIDRAEFGKHHEQMREKHQSHGPAGADKPVPEADEHATHH